MASSTETLEPQPAPAADGDVKTAGAGGWRACFTLKDVLLYLLIAALACLSAGFAHTTMAAGAAADRQRLAAERARTDPRTGPVLVFEKARIFKQCDGATLVYWSATGRSSGPGPVVNSDECRYPPKHP